MTLVKNDFPGLHWFGRAGALLVAGLGVVVMVGWFLQIEQLKSVLPGMAIINVNTACSFTAAGVSLLLLHASAPGSLSFQLARVLAVFVAMLGAAALAEGLFGLYLGIDQLILPDDATAAGQPHPGNISSATEVSFLCAGLALVVFKARDPRIAACCQWLVLPPLMISTMAIVGTAYGANSLYQTGGYTSIAPHSAVAFFVLALSTLALDSTHGFAGIATSDTAGGVVCRRLLSTIPVILFVLGWAHLRGEGAGLFGYQFGLASMVVTGIAVCAIAVASTAISLHKTDLTRKEAMAQIRALNARLDRQEEERKQQLAQSHAELSAANKLLEQLSQHDGLTGVANRRYFDKYLEGQIAIARRHNRSVALVLCDVDVFKAYNDHYGHQAGDECLKQVAAAVQSCSRRTADIVARYGGEEFALILPETTLKGAARVAETARYAVAQLKIPHGYSPAGPHVSISGGVAATLWQGETTAQQLIAAADKMLYEAKRLGRNRMLSARAVAA
jgi:diguanylate cyclase (GGDEF)-like protein